VFLVANGALRTDDLFRPDAHLLDICLVIPFADIVPTGGNNPSLYQVFIKRQLQDVSAYSTSSQTGWKAGQPLADRLYATLVFYLLWQGPTPWDDFWPDWPVNVFPPSHNAFIAAQAKRDEGERQREAKAREQALLAVKTLRLYEPNTNDRHTCVFLLRRLLHYFPSEHFIRPNVLEHVNSTAECSVAQAAHHFCFQQSSSQLFAGTEDAAGSVLHGSFLHHSLERDGEWVQEVLDFGQRAVRFLSHF
jgi:hypothetical protein